MIFFYSEFLSICSGSSYLLVQSIKVTPYGFINMKIKWDFACMEFSTWW